MFNYVAFVCPSAEISKNKIILALSSLHNYILLSVIGSILLHYLLEMDPVRFVIR